MTREEAIRCLDVYSSTNGSGLCTDKQHYEAKQMAIKALKQEPCDVCKYNPPGSGDGKPCTMCPAESGNNELEQEPCEMTAEEYRQRMIQAFHNADTDELIAICVRPTENEFEFLEWLLKNHYKKEPCEDAELDFVQPHKKIPVNLELCEDVVSRQAMNECIETYCGGAVKLAMELRKLPSVNPQPKTGHCKNCKYFEYDSVAKVDGVPLIVAHEICKKWGDGCKTSEKDIVFCLSKTVTQKWRDDMKKVNTQRLSDMLDELEKANANNESITVALMGSIAANLASIADSLETITEERYETKRS